MAKNLDCCGDCSASAPAWASVNRGIFLCDDCGSIHRTLGRHVSIVKSLKRGTWPTSLLSLVKELHASGSNEIWEHQLLLDPSSSSSINLPMPLAGSSRKPMSNDSASKKQEFIQSKHRYLSFVQRIDKSSASAQEALNEDLYNVVRTGAVKDALRYVVLGADPNWSHPQRKMRSLHIASRSGQALQVELLLLWGGDPLLEDEHCQQAAELALAAGHEAIALRLQEAAFEVPDRLTSFITNGRRPDHAHGIHFLEPELSDVSLNDDQRQARKLSQANLKALTNEQLRNLSNDIYDEVDRRELDEQFAAHSSVSSGGHHHRHHASATISPHGSTPFLPVDPRFSAVRNQARQKLALLNQREFVWLIVDLLGEIRRRYGHQQAVELVKIPSAKLLARDSGSSQKDAVNDFSSEERLPTAKQYGNTLNRNGTTGRLNTAKVGPRLRELPSTVSSSDAFVGDGFDENGDESSANNATGQRAAGVRDDADMNLNTDAEDIEMPDYDDVEDAAAAELLPRSGGSTLDIDVLAVATTAAVVNGHKPPLAVRGRGGTISTSPRVSSNEQLKTCSKRYAGAKVASSRSTVENESTAVMMTQLLEAVNGLRADFRDLSHKVELLWEEHSSGLVTSSIPTQDAMSEATVNITRRIQALKLSCEADNLSATDAASPMQYCAATSDAVRLLINSFTAVDRLLSEDFLSNLSNLGACAADVTREGRALQEILNSAGAHFDVRSVDVESTLEKNIVEQKKKVMDAAYMVAKNLRSLHTAYGQMLQEASPVDAELVNNNSGPANKQATTEVADSSTHYAVIRPAAK